MSKPYSEYTDATINSMAFTPKEQKAGKHTELINYLLSLEQVDQEMPYRPDIHVWTDGYCVIVDWIMKGDKDDPFNWVPLDADHCIDKYETEDGSEASDSTDGNDKEQ